MHLLAQTMSLGHSASILTFLWFGFGVFKIMGWYRKGKLISDHFRNLASRVTPQTPIFQRSSRIRQSGYLDSGSKGASFIGLSSFCSISQRLGTRGVAGVNKNLHNPFLFGAKRFYYVDPYNVQHFRPRGPRRWFQNPRHVFFVVLVGSGVLITVYFGNIETVPYTKRTHLILLSKAMERKLGESQFEQMKAGFKGKILPPIHPDSVRVTMIAKDIIDALQRGLRKEQVWSDLGYASEHSTLSEGYGRETLNALATGSDEKSEGNWHKEDEILDDKWVQQSRKKGQEKGSEAATSHLDGLNWEILVVNEPVVNAFCLPGGKIVVFTGLLEHFKSDAEIAIIIGHEVGHAIARHSAEGITKNLWFAILQLILYQFVTPDIVHTMSSLFLHLPFSRRMEIEADSKRRELLRPETRTRFCVRISERETAVARGIDGHFSLFNRIVLRVFLAMAATATASSMGPRYAPPDPTLPKPWKGLVDGKTGYLYYWNPETNVTQYERPSTSAALPKSSSVPSSSVQVQHVSQGSQRGHSPDFSDRYDRNGSGGSNEAGSRNNQSSKGGSYSSHSLPTGTNAAANVNYPVKGHGASEAAAVLSPESYRSRHEITVTGDNVPPPLASFGSTGFPPELLREVQNAGFAAPTPIQAQSWPIALQSRDIVAIAKTGSGKTLGYLIPAFIHLKRCGNNSKMGPTALVLSPTRELATQIQDEAVKFGKSSRISCACLYGGAPKGPQLRDIDRGADIVVATPGRLNDILEMRRISLQQVSYLVLDEADRMLDMGFEPQIRKIVNEVPNRRQTLMYTATWPKEVRKIAADLLVKPVQVNIGNVDELVANKSITQHIEVLPLMEKQRRLEHILRSQDQGSKIIIFCSTKKMCDQLARNLTRQFGAAAIHGDKSQAERDHVLSQFRTGRSPVLVATDVAARGLDIKDIRVVVNYDFPTGVEDYVHRIGRTGRAGATGLAYTFFGDQDAKYASDLIKVLEGADQKVPPELRDMSLRGGGGMGRSRRWGSGGRGGRGDSGYGGRNNDSGYGGRGDYGGYGGRGSDSNYGGRGNASGRGGRGFDYDSQRNDRGGSPEKGSRWSDRYKGVNRERSRSPDRAALPQHSQSSFHKSMMERGGWGGDSDRNKNSSNNRDRSRSPSPYRQERSQRSPVQSFHRSMMGSPRQRPRSPRSNNTPSKDWYNGEVEEGMIPEEEGIIGPQAQGGGGD